MCFVSTRDGNLGDISKAGSLHEFLTNLHKEYGPIASFWWGKMYTISIASADLFEEQQHLFDRHRKYCTYSYNWATTRENLYSGVGEQQRRKPACASAQSDQRICYSLNGKYDIWTCYERNFNFLASLCS